MKRFIVLMLFAVFVNAKTFFVRNSIEFREALQKAAYSVENDDIILLEGLYKTTDDNESTFIYNSDNEFNITIKGDENSNVILSGNKKDQILKVVGAPFLKLYNITFAEGRSDYKGGALYVSGMVQIEKCKFYDNKAEDSGGGFYSYLPPIVKNSEFVNNSAYSGGGFSSYSGMSKVYSSIFKNNRCMYGTDSRGGGIHSEYGSVYIDKSEFIKNSAYKGGGVYAFSDSEIANSKFMENDAVFYGGGVHIYQNISIYNSIFLDNSSNFGGAVYCGNISLINSLFYNNKDDNIYVNTYDNHNVIANSIFLDKHSTVLDSYSKSSFIYLYNNYINLARVYINHSDKQNIFDDVELGFADLSKNDFHLLKASDLIDKGTENIEDLVFPKKDLDGHNRVINNQIDIGPYEYQDNIYSVLDSDKDGIPDNKDAFPNDPAASIDSDGDGHPDRWNDGYSESDSTTGLKLDSYPNDPSRWMPATDDVAKLYVATFGRAPDDAGLNYWINNSHLTLEQIAKSFFDQPETQQMYATDDIHLFVQKIYENLFNREPDSAGWNYWENELNSGKIPKSYFILAVINGAKDKDKTILENKKEVGLKFANSGLSDINKAKEVMKGITDNSSTVDYAVKKIEDGDISEGMWDGFNIADKSYSEILAMHKDSISIIFDDSLPLDEQKYIKDFHTKVTAVLSYITGIEPKVTFEMTYDPNGHRSWNPDITVLKLDKLPSNDIWFKSWYTVEIAHQYFKPLPNEYRSLPKYSNELRYNEYNSQAITSIVASKYGKDLGYNDVEINFYSAQLDDRFYTAIENFIRNSSIFSIFQTDTNYNMNPTTIAVATHNLLSLYKKDRNFFKNFLSSGSSWNGYKQYKEALAKAIYTLPYDQALKFVDGLLYFKQIDDIDNRPDINIDIALFSKKDFPKLTTNQQFYYDTPQSYIIYGQSNNKELNPPGTESWDIIPDPKLFNAQAEVTIYNKDNDIIYHKTDIDIKTDFANRRSGYLPSSLHSGENYTIKAVVEIDGKTYIDSMKFTYIDN